MKNTINKVFIKKDGDKSYIIVVGNQRIDKYMDLISFVFQEQYNRVILWLQSTYPKYSKIKEPYELVKAMRDDGLITYIKKDEDLISDVIYNEEDNTYVVNYYSGKRKTSNEDNNDSYDVEDAYEKLVSSLCEQYNKTPEELQKLGVIKGKKNSKLISSIKDLKIKNLVTKKRLIALGVATALVVTGFGISELKGRKKSDNKNNKDNSIIEDEEYLYPEEVIITELPSLDEVNLYDENYFQPDIDFSTPDFILEGNQIAVEIYEGSFALRENQEADYQSYEQLEQHSFENMSDIGNIIQNESSASNLETIGKLVYYEKYFDNEIEKAFISHFNKYRNEIIWQAFSEKNIDKARDYIRQANKEAVRVIYDGNPIQIVINNEFRNLYYDDLSQNAKDRLLNIVWSMFDPFINDTFEYENETYDQVKVAERVFGLEVNKTK